MAVDDRQDVFGLVGHAAAGRLVGDDAGEIDGVAVDDDLAHARPGLKTLDGHAVLPVNAGALLSAPWRHPPLRFPERAYAALWCDNKDSLHVGMKAAVIFDPAGLPHNGCH